MLGTLANLPDALIREGLRPYVVSEWRTNGHDDQLLITDVWGTLLHHTADNAGLGSVWDPRGDRRPSVPQPRANAWVPRGLSYDVAVVSSGRAYHAGDNSGAVLNEIRAGRISQYTLDAAQRGLADTSNGNGVLFGIEVENTGTGQPLTAKQLFVLPRVCAALCRLLGQSVGHIAHHRQATSRKPDMFWRGDIWGMTADILSQPPGASMSEFGPEHYDDADWRAFESRLRKLLGEQFAGWLAALSTGDLNGTTGNAGPPNSPERVRTLARLVGTIPGQLDALNAKVDALGTGTPADPAATAYAIAPFLTIEGGP